MRKTMLRDNAEKSWEERCEEYWRIPREKYLAEALQIDKRTGEIITCPYPKFEGIYLHDVYGRYSEEKAKVWKKLFNEVRNELGKFSTVLDYGILSHNDHTFSFGFVFEVEFEEYDTSLRFFMRCYKAGKYYDAHTEYKTYIIKG